MTPRLQVVPGTVEDVPAMLQVLDAAVRWLVEQGNTGQWGTEPFSVNPKAVAANERWAASGGVYLARVDRNVVAALVVGSAPAYVPAATEPELYINLLVTDHSPSARGAGRHLLDHARAVARERGVTQIRVDCYAGHGGGLVRYYERQGFTATDSFSVDQVNGPWAGQVLRQRLETDRS